MTSCAVGVPESASSVATALGEHTAMTSFSSSTSFLRWFGRELLFLRLDPRPNPVPNAGIGAFLAKPLEPLNFSLDLLYLFQ